MKSETGWVAAEVDRRIQQMEAETGRKVPCKEKREIKRRMVRGMARGSKRIEDAVVTDRNSATRHDLAKKLKRAGVVSEAVYLRLGALPEGYESGVRSKALFGYEEKGLSVFAGTLTTDGHYIVKLPNRWLRSSLMRFCQEEAREAYLVRGESAGKGSDGEPLLSRVDAVEALEPDRIVAAEPSSRALEDWNDRRAADVREFPVFREVLRHSTGKTSLVHGPEHWRRVAETGRRLARAVGADRTVVLLFAFFHDAMRLSDDTDPEHGVRAAELAEKILGGRLASERLSKLTKACALHADGLVSDDPTIGVCWDADRLDLGRVGTVTEARLLSTEAGVELLEARRKDPKAGPGGGSWGEILDEDDEMWTVLDGSRDIVEAGECRRSG